MKKFILTICSFAFLLSEAYAARPACPNGTTEGISCWECGVSCTASLSDGVLTVSGSGYMSGYSGGDSAPWYASKSLIHSVVVEGANEAIGTSGIVNIGNAAFAGMDTITSVTFGDSVNGIGVWAFSSCTSLTSVSFPDNFQSIGWGAFNGATNLKSVVIGGKVSTIMPSAFKNIDPNAKIYCQDTTENRCSDLLNDNHGYNDCNDCTNSYALSKLVLFEKEGDLYKIKNEDIYFATKDMMANGVSCTKKECQELLNTPADGQILFHGKFYNSLADIATGNYIKKRIYTIEEATKVSKEMGNTFKLRYK